ncbi:hypothetical protein BJ165DRAFT_1340153, partial [Panaeolus papilionaceus]
RSGMVVSGHSALQVFARLSHEQTELRLYVQSRHMMRVVEWFERRRYRFLNSRRQYPGTRLLSRRRLNQDCSLSSALVLCLIKGDLRVLIIGCPVSPLATILGFHSTAMMNFITYKRAYCLFAKATLHEFRSFSLDSAESSSIEDDAELERLEWGWQIVRSASLEDTQYPDGAFVCATCRPGDSLCWSIDLPPLPIAMNGMVERNGFDLVAKGDGKLGVEFTEMRSIWLKFGHIVLVEEGVRFKGRNGTKVLARRVLEQNIYHDDF